MTNSLSKSWTSISKIGLTTGNGINRQRHIENLDFENDFIRSPLIKELKFVFYKFRICLPHSTNHWAVEDRHRQLYHTEIQITNEMRLIYNYQTTNNFRSDFLNIITIQTTHQNKKITSQHFTTISTSISTL